MTYLLIWKSKFDSHFLCIVVYPQAGQNTHRIRLPHQRRVFLWFEVQIRTDDCTSPNQTILTMKDSPVLSTNRLVDTFNPYFRSSDGTVTGSRLKLHSYLRITFSLCNWASCSASGITRLSIYADSCSICDTTTARSTALSPLWPCWPECASLEYSE